MKMCTIYRQFPKDLHGKIGGILIQQNKNSYLIVIDIDMPEKQKDFVLRHELAHLAARHKMYLTDSPWDYQEIEADLLAESKTFDVLFALCAKALKVDTIDYSVEIEQ